MPNLTEDGLRAYLEQFESAFRETVEAFIEPDLRNELERLPLLDRRVIGYVSTQFGVGIEYTDESRPGGIETTYGSARIEHLVFGDAPRLLRESAAFFGPGNARIESITFDGRLPVYLQTTYSKAVLVNCFVRFRRWSRRIHHLELYGDRSTGYWTEVEATRRAKDEVLVALVDQQRLAARSVDLSTYLERFKERLVLVLGDFRNGRDRLEAIKEGLTGLGYEPLLLDEIDDPFEYDLRQKFLAVGHVCRFLVFEDSTAAGQLWELASATGSGLVRLILRRENEQSSFMSVGQSLTESVVRESEYTPATLSDVLKEGAEWAEERLGELRQGRADLYPWRPRLAEDGSDQGQS